MCIGLSIYGLRSALMQRREDRTHYHPRVFSSLSLSPGFHQLLTQGRIPQERPRPGPQDRLHFRPAAERLPRWSSIFRFQTHRHPTLGRRAASDPQAGPRGRQTNQSIKQGVARIRFKTWWCSAIPFPPCLRPLYLKGVGYSTTTRKLCRVMLERSFDCLR